MEDLLAAKGAARVQSPPMLNTPEAEGMPAIELPIVKKVATQTDDALAAPELGTAFGLGHSPGDSGFGEFAGFWGWVEAVGVLCGMVGEFGMRLVGAGGSHFGILR